ncbi:MAG: hypothetical protein M0D57_09595 [Sphingobacteriales bacterium JAD_PAG50586_3]|nr:MAG: hypothetical protein M0D57_09595 [Sphingobacteriales bacterium JAD_PAG50586_3]
MGSFLKYTVLVVTCLCCVVSHAQLTFNNPQVYTTNNGLSQSSVYGILQSRQGYMWFATGDGICRFDGREWKTYRNNFTYKGKPASNLYNTALYTDSAGSLWFSNSSGAYYIKPESNAVTYFCPNADTAKFFNHIIHLIGIQNGNTAWIGGNGYLYKTNTLTNKTTAYNFSKYVYKQSTSISASLFTNDKIYLGLVNRVVVFDIKTGTFKSIKIEGNEMFTPLDLEYCNGKVYLSSVYGLHVVNEDGIEKISEVDFPVMRFFKRNNTQLFSRRLKITLSNSV